MIYNIINSIKICEKNKKKNLIIKKTNKNLNLILYLVKINFIKFIKIYKNLLIIKLNLINNTRLLFNIQNMYKNSNLKYINIKKLKQLKNKKYFLIISTNKGIKNNFDCANKNVGGVLLILLWS